MRKNLFIKLGFLFIILGLVSISIDHVSAYISDYNSDVERSKEIAKEINENYDSFNDKLVGYKDNLLSTYNSFDIYLDEFLEKKDTIILNMNKISDTLNSIDYNAEILSKNCNYDLSNKILESKCDMFSLNYESILESYDKMIETYNSLVDNYNLYANEQIPYYVSSYSNN